MSRTQGEIAMADPVLGIGPNLNAYCAFTNNLPRLARWPVVKGVAQTLNPY